MTKKVYLCGPITGLSYDQSVDWRKYVAKHIAQDIIAVSPMRGKLYLQHEKEIGHSYEESIMSCSRAITARDKWDVCTNCDLVLANFLGAERVSIGSCIELGWASATNKPIVLVTEDPSETRNVHEHPIVDQVSGWRVNTLDEAITVCNAILSDKFAKENH